MVLYWHLMDFSLQFSRGFLNLTCSKRLNKRLRVSWLYSGFTGLRKTRAECRWSLMQTIVPSQLRSATYSSTVPYLNLVSFLYIVSCNFSCYCYYCFLFSYLFWKNFDIFIKLVWFFTILCEFKNCFAWYYLSVKFALIAYYFWILKKQ